MVFPTIGRFIDASGGFALLAFAFLTWRVRPASAATRWFTVFAASFGAMLTLGNIVLAEPWGPRLWWASFLLLPPAMLGVIMFALRYPRPLLPDEWRNAWIAAGVTLLAALPYIVVVSRTGWRLTPANWGAAIETMAYALDFALVLLPLRFASATGPGAFRERSRYAAIAIGLTIPPAYFWVGRALRARWAPLEDPMVAFGLPHAALYVLVALLWVRASALTTRPASALARNVALATVGIPAASVLFLNGPWFPPEQAFVLASQFGLGGALRFASLAVLAHAILKDSVFEVGLRLANVLRRAVVVLVFAAAFGMVYSVSEATFAQGRGLLLGVGAIFALLLFYSPVDAVAGRIVSRAVPIQGTERLDKKRLDVYRAALEDTALRGELGLAESEERLEALRTQLGLTDRDHVVLVHALATGGRAAWADLGPGSVVLGRFRVEGRLGEGAHGWTYLARDVRTMQRVVLKVARPGPGERAALVREIQAMRGRRHPHIVRVLEVVEGDDAVFLVLEHIEGGSLKSRLEKGPLDAAAFARLARGVLLALEEVHGAGIVHRDVKPSNILLTREGEAKLADFGIARLPGSDTTIGTPDGSAIGTLRYMSPEQAKGWRTGPRGDLFSVAATLYEALTGRPYFAVDLRESAIELQMRVAAVGPFDAPCPPEMREWFSRALAPRAEDRFASAQEMLDALTPR